MATKDLKYFMRNDADEIIDVPAPSSFKDETGKTVIMQVKKLSAGAIQRFNKRYRHESVGVDPKTKRPYSENGKLLKKDDTDYERAGYALVCDALVFPNPKDKELMDFYKTADPIDVLFGMFRDQEDLNYVVEVVLDVLGLRGTVAKEDIDEVKN